MHVLSRIRKDGTLGHQDLTQSNLGLTKLAIANGKIYWAGSGALMGCSLPNCGEGPTVQAAGQTDIRNVFSNASRTAVFWTSGQNLMTLSRATPLVMGESGTGSANDSFVWFSNAQNRILKVPVGGGSAADIGPGAEPQVNTTGVFYIWNVPNAAGVSPGLHYYSLAAGAGSAPQIVGNPRYDHDLFYGFTIDDQYAYWMYVGDDAFLAKCAVTGCGNSPTTLRLSGPAIDNGANGLTGDAQALYWASQSGIFKLAK